MELYSDSKQGELMFAIVLAYYNIGLSFNFEWLF